MRPEVTHPDKVRGRRGFLLGAAAAIGGLSMSAGAASAEVTLMSASDAHKAATAGDILLVDIRTPEEWSASGVGEGAVALDMRAKDFVDNLVTLRRTYPDKPIALICATGGRTSYVTRALDKQGFPGLVDVSEGMFGNPRGRGWLNEDLPTYEGSAAQIAARLKAVMP